MNSAPLAAPAQPEQLRIVLSDFDRTLCDTYDFDPATNNHLPQIDSDLVDAAQGHNLIVATGRRANHPSLPILWLSGLVHPQTPVIAENGGTLVFHSEDGQSFVDLVAPDDVAQIHAMKDTVREHVDDIPDGQELIFKLGRTMLVTRLQDPEGNAQPEHLAWLAERIRQLLPASSAMQVVGTRDSLTVQHADINKGVGFRRYLALAGIDRADTYVVGMGDADNDREIFEAADFRIGFSSDVRSLVDIEVPNGAQGAPGILRTIRGKPSAHR